jgi:hypothetical protein
MLERLAQERRLKSAAFFLIKRLAVVAAVSESIAGWMGVKTIEPPGWTVTFTLSPTLIRARSMSAASKMMPWEFPTFVMVFVIGVILCFTKSERQTANWTNAGRRFAVRKSELGKRTNTTSPRRVFIVDGRFGSIPILRECLQAGTEIARLHFADPTRSQIDSAVIRCGFLQTVECCGLLICRLFAWADIFILRGKLAQLFKHSPTLSVAQLREFFDDLRCAHGEIIAVIGNLSARLIETFPIGTENKGRRQKAAAFASAREDSLKGRLVAVVFARRSLELSVNLPKCGAKFRRQKAGWNPRHNEVERINHRRR